jgi:glucuronoarabinoxylan endo-1,4-beta-xylanase
MSQYSRFIRPGYHRVKASTIPVIRSLRVTAYQDSTSSKTVMVAVNSDLNPLQLVVRLENNSVNSFTPYITSESKNVVQGDDVQVIKNKIMLTLEASSITTFVSK